MATFKVGQRVKRISGAKGAAYDFAPADQEGVIVGLPGWVCKFALWPVRFDSGKQWDCVAESLVPLSDPGADAFMESLRKLKPLHEEPTVRKVITTPAGSFECKPDPINVGKWIAVRQL